MRSEVEINPNDVELFVQGAHHDMFARLRATDPFYWHTQPWGGGFWNVTKYDDLITVSRAPNLFSSEGGIILGNRPPRRPPEQREAQRDGMRRMGASMSGSMMIMSDPPKHTRLRQLVNKGFTPRAVARLEPHVREVVNGIIDEVIERGECDFVADISKKLPLVVICELMGVPEGDWEAMFELTNRMIGGEDPDYRPRLTPEQEMEMAQRNSMLFMQLIEDRRNAPLDDLTSKLVGAEMPDGSKLTEFELYMFFLLLIIAGNETTRNATSGGMLELIAHAGQRGRLEADPSLLPTAVEEILRWTSPVTHFVRVATQDTDVRGKAVSAGDRVVLWYPSVNRDEEVFGPDAMQFRIDRQPNEHLAFGIGEHFCLGANLARLELKVMFEELLSRLRDWELAGEVERLRSNFLGGIKRMPVSFRAA